MCCAVPVFAGVAQASLPGALFAFSTEALDNSRVPGCPAAELDAVYRLMPTGRFAHGREYVRASAAAHGLRIVSERRTVLR